MKILLVCLGNICRSPTAEAALREAFRDAGAASSVTIDSAGTGDWHIGHPPDPRMTDAAASVGLTLEGSARQVTRDDLADYDLILAMDRQNARDLHTMAAGDADLERRIRLFREFEPDREPGDSADIDVPDPYYGGPEGFERVVSIVRAAAAGVVDHVRAQLPG